MIPQKDMTKWISLHLKNHYLIFCLILVILFFSKDLTAQVNWSGWHYSEYARYQDIKRDFYENWTEFRFGVRHWTLGIRMEMHIPSHPFSPEANGRKISQTFFKFQNGDYDVTIGNFYKIVGRGLVFHSFENRSIRWDTNVLGVAAGFQKQKIAFNLFGGKPRDRSGKRIPMVYGSSLLISPNETNKLGLHILSSRTIEDKSVTWGSLSLDQYFPGGNLYVELAYSEPFAPGTGSGNAIFLSGDLFLSDYTLHLEYKNYHHFQLSYGSLYNYNNLPTAFREHIFTLLNRKQHLVNGNNETGFMAELSGPIKDIGNWLLNVSQSFLRDGTPVYREYYSQFELENLDKYEFILAGGVEKDFEADYKNGVFSATYYMSESYSLKFQIEHQHETIHFSQRKFYNQLYTLSYSYQPVGSISFIMETTRDQLASRKNWSGIQFTTNSINHLDLNVFLGRRREGKICAGGVCVYKPEFSGIELTMNVHFP